MTYKSFSDLLRERRSIREFDEGPISLSALNRLIWAAQGKTSKMGGKTVPSAHALYPLRLFAFAANVTGLKSGFYTVDTEDGKLEIQHNKDIRSNLQAAAVDDQSWIGDAACIISVCADFVAACQHFSDQEPYGQRGIRYVYIEAGAATQNMLLQAAAEALAAVMVAGFKDEATCEILNLPANCAPVLHICIGLPKSRQWDPVLARSNMEH